MKKTENKGKSFLKLFVAAAILALIFQVVLDLLKSEIVYEETFSDNKISININDLALSFLSEYFQIFLVIFFVLWGMRFLYFRFVYRKENNIKLI